jgi:hypothetical protein
MRKTLGLMEAQRGEEMNPNGILKLLRGSVRPLVLLAIVAAIIGFLASGKVEEAKILIGVGALPMGFWFAERQNRRENGTD